MKNTAAELKPLSDILRIDEIAVMRHGKIAFDMADNKRLNIVYVFSACSRIPYVTDCHIAHT